MGSISIRQTAVALIGAGTQGRRLAHMWTSCGSNVHLIDEKPSQLRDALAFVDELRERPEYQMTQWGSITTHSPEALDGALKDSWLAIESVPERLPIKRQIISKLDALAPAGTIIASNSSSYTIAEIIDGLDLKDERRILSAHTYWPPETPAIEIMGHDRTDPMYIETLMHSCAAHGFEPFHVKRSSLGYIYNRIWAAIKRESLLVAAEGIATPEEVDKIFKCVLKTRLGPFEQMDVVGLDVVYDIEQHYADSRTGIPSEPREYLQKLIREGRLGVKNGRGFYNYEDKA
ncbi:hypothetical protein M433DRAFT_580 [Acidomyces richmondensis BFW]|nr:MAG: hypothetical protein FE78DRAFT_144889 [Acidomyces sp. 'richmondensis']KYG50054.1 hypothetical protein M433DRAFT_580 [Acidomyces richmondensis BFW]